MRTDWLKSQFRYWVRVLSVCDIQRVEVAIYAEWSKIISVDHLRKIISEEGMSIPDDNPNPIRYKIDLVNCLMEPFMEKIYEIYEYTQDMATFPKSVSGKILMSIRMLSCMRAPEARLQFLKWNEMVGCLVQHLYPDPFCDHWQFVLSEISSIYYEWAEEGETDVIDFCRGDLYKKYEYNHVFGIMFTKEQNQYAIINSDEDMDAIYRPDNVVQETKEQVQEAKEPCCVCLDVPREWCQFVCRHAMCSSCFASQCIIELYTNNRYPSCPLCRAVIQTVVKQNETYNKGRAV